jgi:hypothetical protein
MTTFVKLYVQGELSKMPVVYDRFGTNGLRKEECSFVAPGHENFILNSFNVLFPSTYKYAPHGMGPDIYVNIVICPNIYPLTLLYT